MFVVAGVVCASHHQFRNYDAFYGVCVSMFLKRFDAVSRSMCLVLSTGVTFAVNSVAGVVTPGPFEFVAFFASVSAVGLAV